jgi:hypothetical protein
VPPEIRTCDRRSGKLTQSCRPFPDKFGLPLRLLRGTERSESWGALHNTLPTDCGGTAILRRSPAARRARIASTFDHRADVQRQARRVLIPIRSRANAGSRSSGVGEMPR